MYIKISGETSKIISNIASKRQMTFEEALNFVVKSFSERSYYSQILVEEKITSGEKGRIPRTRQPKELENVFKELSLDNRAKGKRNLAQCVRSLILFFYKITIKDLKDIDAVIKNHSWMEKREVKKIIEGSLKRASNDNQWVTFPQTYQDIEYINLFNEIGRRYRISKTKILTFLSSYYNAQKKA